MEIFFCCFEPVYWLPVRACPPPSPLPPPSPPHTHTYFWAKKEQMTEGRKAGWVSKIEPAPSSDQSLDLSLLFELLSSS